jgi:nitrate reductase gamma subunit
MTATIAAETEVLGAGGLLLAQVEPAYWLIVASIGAALFIASALTRFYLWSRGRTTFRDELSSLSMWGLMRMSIKAAFSRDCFTARRLFDQSSFRGLHLVLIIWGPLMLFFGAIIIVLFQDLGVVQLELLANLVDRIWLDLFGSLTLVGVVAAIVKRAMIRSVRQLTSMQDSVLILMFLVLLIQGFIVKGLYLQTGGVGPLESSPVAWAFGQLLLAPLQNPSQVGDLLLATLMIHELTAVLFVVYIPHSKMFHIFASPITTQIAAKRYGGFGGNRETKAPGIIAEGKKR